MTKEQILPVVGYEGLYSVSDLGQVYSMPKKWVSGKGCVREIKKPVKMSMSFDNSGYRVVGLRKGDNLKQYKVHRLVAIAFIPNPLNKPCVNHIDGDKGNNKLENLEWVTVKENGTHAKNTGLYNHVFGEKHGSCKLTEKSVIEIRKSTLTSRELGKKYGVSHYHINAIKSGRKWSHVK